MKARAKVRQSCPRRHAQRVASALAAGLLACLPAALRAQQVHECRVRPQPATISFAQINLSRDTAIGAPISEEQRVYTLVECPQTPRRRGFGFVMRAIPVHRVSTAVADVWETGVPGIGVRVYSETLGRVISNTNSVELGTIWSRGSIAVGYDHRHQLVKTGPIDASGLLNFGAAYVYRHTSATTGLVRTHVLATVSLGTITLAPRSCRVTTPNVGVTLPNTQASTLGNNGASIGNTGFFIGLQCDDNTDVHITLTDATTPGNRTNLLSLTADSTARGVAVRVRRPDNAPVSFGPDSSAAGNTNQWRVGQRSGATTIRMSAEYVATGTVTAGTVRALATFTMSYH